MVCLYSIKICYDIFVSYDFFNFFWNMFNSKAIKIYYIITIPIQSYPISSFDLNVSRFIIYPPSFILGKLFLKHKPLNLGSF